MPATTKGQLFFDADKLGSSENNYVCWIDVMGSKEHLRISPSIASNFIFKLHIALLESLEKIEDSHQQNLVFYPIMDGAYITSRTQKSLELLLCPAMKSLANLFIKENNNKHRFMVRGAIAFGPVFHGKNIQEEASKILARQRNITNKILIGLPIVQANEAESKAPPYGIVIHETARAFAPDGENPVTFVWLNWNKGNGSARLDSLDEALKSYFSWHRERPNVTGYSLKQIDRHSKLAEELISVLRG